MPAKKNQNGAVQEEYKPFGDGSEQDDLGFLFGGSQDPGNNSQKTPVSTPPQNNQNQTVTVEQIIGALPDAYKKPILDLIQERDTFRNKNASVDTLSSQIGLLLQKNGQQIQQEEDPTQEIVQVFKDLGIISEEHRIPVLVKAIDKLVEKRSKSAIDPYINHYLNRTAQEERTQVENLYPKDQGFPTFADSGQNIQRILQENPGLSLKHAYELANLDKIVEIRGKKDQNQNPALNLTDLSRKLTNSGETPQQSSQENFQKKPAGSLSDALDQAAQELGIQLR